MSGAELFALNLGIIAIAMVLLWLASLALEDVSIVDIFWGLGFVLIAWVTFLVTDGGGTRKGLLVGLTTIWGLRLGGYLAWRNLGQGEDYRYQALRRRLGKRFWLTSLPVVFGLQGALMCVISLPVQMGESAPPTPGITLLQALGVACWAVGLFFEAVGDLQLARFKADPANDGKVLDQGLWRYTRHPNYFGDFLVWWGLYLVAVSTPAGFRALGWTAIGPVIMSILLLRISGVPLLEAALRRRRAGYDDYVRRTSAFFPRRPRAD